jgi:hypothetical protein
MADSSTESGTRRRNRRRSAARTARARVARERGATAAITGTAGQALRPLVRDPDARIVVDLPIIEDPFASEVPADRPVPAFAHASEAEMARILDFYRIRWEYEPHTFPILWNLEGAVIESFSPDFWLPDLDLYLEMTTLRQKLVRKKNRKLRRIHELYPDIRVKLYYARDFRALMLKFGRLALADELTGTSGQVVPDRSADAEDA